MIAIDNVINVLCASDNNYVPYCGIMLTSLFESNKNNRFEVYLMHDGSLSQKNVNKLNLLREKYGNTIHLITVASEFVSGYSVHSATHVLTMPTYYRLLSADILPMELHKVLYLDCDIIVNGNVKVFWDTDIDGYAVSAVKDCSFHYNGQTYKRLGYSDDFGYFNAGVLLINLDYWRGFQLAKQYKEFYQNAGPEQLWMMDQDILNSVLYDKKKLVQERFNFQTEVFMSNFWCRYPKDYQDNLMKECDAAVIFHYCGSLKPWNRRYNKTVFFNQWNFYRKKSLWKYCRTWEPFLKYAKYIIKKIFFPSKLKGIWIQGFEEV